MGAATRGERWKVPGKRPRVWAGPGWGAEGWLEGGEGVRALAEKALVLLTPTSAFSGAAELELALSQSGAISTWISKGSPSLPTGSHKAGSGEASARVGHHLQPRHCTVVPHGGGAHSDTTAQRQPEVLGLNGLGGFFQSYTWREQPTTG